MLRQCFSLSQLRPTLAFSIFLISKTLVGLAAGADAKTSESLLAANSPKINLNAAIDITLPVVAGLKPVRFRTPDGKAGWVLRIPGHRPIPTPAYADGLLFVGGGYGSHEFYAFEATTGALAWRITTSDDGPTAAVVEDGYVGFNTESCTVIVVEEKTGKVIWQEWLGDPLMSQPAISTGRLFIAYPSGQKHPKQQLSTGLSKNGSGYRLLAVDLKTGHHLWQQEIPTDVISAPVVDRGHVYATCFDGTSLAIEASTGHILWRKQGSATSAPIVAGEQIILTRRWQHSASQYEGLARLDASNGNDKDKELLAKSRADYLAAGEGRALTLPADIQKSLDQSVGFAGAPLTAKMEVISKNTGVNSIAGGWAYQGSRAAESNGALFNVEGRFVNSLRAEDGSSRWRAEIIGRSVNDGYQLFSPPALGKEYLYLSSATGHLVSVRKRDGEAGFIYAFQKPMVFQPALVHGSIYVGSSDGLLICLETESKDADGWYGWGGNAQHNK